MTKFEWNQLSVGDAIIVHDVSATTPALAVLGQVAFVRPGSRRKETEVGVRRAVPADAEVLWPGRLQAHLPDETRGCPWCAMVN
jgi:hypothetical protein